MMVIPRDDQTVHLMTFRDVLRVWWRMHREEGRNVAELALYTTDDLRRRYQEEPDGMVRLRDGIVTRVQLVAEIRLRIFLSRISYTVLLIVSLVAAIASVVAVVKG